MDVSIKNDALDIHDGTVLMQMVARDADERVAAVMDYRVMLRRENGGKEPLSSIQRLLPTPSYTPQLGKLMLQKLNEEVGPFFELADGSEQTEELRRLYSYPIIHPVLQDTLDRALSIRQQMGKIQFAADQGKIGEELSDMQMESLAAPLYGELSDTVYELDDTCAYAVMPANPKVARAAMRLSSRQFASMFGRIAETPDIPLLDKKDESFPFSKENLNQLKDALSVGYLTLHENKLLKSKDREQGK